MDFNEVLKNGVVGYSEKDKLKEKLAELEIQLEEENTNVIKDPSKIKGLEKQILETKKELTKLEKSQPEVSGEPDETGALDDKKKAAFERDAVEDGEKTKQKKEQNDDESIVPSSDDETPEEESKEKGVEDEQALKEAYYNALIALYGKKKEVLRKQISKGKLVSSKADFEAEIKLEAELYQARDKYLALGKEDPYEEKKTTLIKEDKELRDNIEKQFRVRADEYRNLEKELYKLNKEEEELNRLFEDGKISPEELDKKQRDLAIRRKDVGEKLAEVKDSLNEAIEIRSARTRQRRSLIEKEFETLTYEDKRNYMYQKSRVGVMTNDVKQANKLEKDNIESRIFARKQKIEKIYRELRDMTDSTDFERRLELLKELDNEALLLDQDLQNQSYMDRGVELSETEAKREVTNDYKEGQEAKEKLETSDTVRKIEESIEELEEIEGENPNVESITEYAEEQEQDERNRRAATIMTAAAMTGQDGSFGEFATNYVVADTIIRNTHPLGSKLAGETYDVNNPEDAKVYVDKVEEIDRRTDELTKTITDQTKTI